VEKMKRLDTLFHDAGSLILFGSIIILTILAPALIDRGLMNKLVSRSKASNNDTTSIVFIRNFVRLTIYLSGIGRAYIPRLKKLCSFASCRSRCNDTDHGLFFPADT
jgi:hypothetical protein